MTIMFIVIFGGFIFGMLMVIQVAMNSAWYAQSVHRQLAFHAGWLVAFVTGFYWLIRWWDVFAS